MRAGSDNDPAHDLRLSRIRRKPAAWVVCRQIPISNKLLKK